MDAMNYNENNRKVAAGLRQIADIIDVNDTLNFGSRKHPLEISLYGFDGIESARKIAKFLHTFKKNDLGELMMINRLFGDDTVEMRFVLTRATVCEQIEVGKKTVLVKRFPHGYEPPPLPAMIEVEEEVPVMQWKCPSLLSEDA